MAQDVFSLSRKGRLAEPQPKADSLLSYYFTSNASQDPMFPNTVVSLPALIQRYGTDLAMLTQTAQREIIALLSPHFDSVTCECRTELIKDGSLLDGRYNLIVSALVMQGGQSYSLGRLLQVQGGAIQKIMHYNNTGTNLT